MQLDLFADIRNARTVHCRNCDAERTEALLRDLSTMRDEAIRNGIADLLTINPAAEVEPGETVEDVRRHFAFRLYLLNLESRRRFAK